jgi:protein-tyrosine phosphatase
MGNICRSPSAEGFFTTALQQTDFVQRVLVDSAGTHGYHIGASPDSRAVDTAAGFGVDIAHLRARKVSMADFHKFDLLIAMDEGNLIDLQSIQPPGSKAELQMMMHYHPEGHPQEVPDPYYGGMRGFTYMCELLEKATVGLVNDIEGRLAG